MSDLERLADLQKTTASCYQQAIRASAEYAVDLNPGQTAEFRQHLLALQQTVEKAEAAEHFQALQSSFRGELREYRDRSREWLEKTRADLKAAAEAMQVLAQNVASNGADHGQQLKDDLRRLVSITDTSDLGKIRTAVRETALSITRSFENMQRETQLLVVQLNDEIRSLHREMNNERKALYTDPVSGAWNRDKINLRMEELLTRGEGFSVVILWISNLKRLECSCSPLVIEGALKAMVKRLAGLLGTDATVGRWSHDEFIVLLDLAPSATTTLCAEMAQALSSRYSVQENGIAQHLTLRLATAIADHPPASNPEKFRAKLQLLAGAMQGS
ncbi:MAG TPA: diguanylate cyclase [Bryobacteraceae bacterium]|jgi:GGDEF domain-containing protein